jgi:D-alanine transfer protein
VAKEPKLSEVAESPRNTRFVLPGIVAAIVAFAVVLAVVEFMFPAQSYVGNELDHGYVCSGAKSSSVKFSTSADGDDALMVFGSSELSTPPTLVGQVPAVVFGYSNSGVNLNYIGEAFDQSLWHSIAAGAYGGKTTNKKVVIIASPNWFIDGGLDSETFKLRFSYQLYRQFMANDAISQESKDYLVRRLGEQGVDATTIRAGQRSGIDGAINDAVFAGMDDLKIRNDLNQVRSLGIDPADIEGGKPSFTDLNVQAKAEGAQKSTNNSWGWDDDSYQENVLDKADRLKGSQAHETFTDTPEYNDFTFLLKVFHEVGFEPLVVISPLSGQYYDEAGVSKQTRQACYDRIKDICKMRGVQVADFTDEEYSKYFLHDQVHFG